VVSGLKVNTDQLAGNYLVLDGSYEYNTLQVFNVIKRIPALRLLTGSGL
jgi:hypothetical protein